MKMDFKKIFHILGTILLIVIFCISFYYLTINILHDSTMNKRIFASENDTYYKQYQINLKTIKNNLDSYHYNKSKYKLDYNIVDNFHNKINYCYNILEDVNTVFNNNTFIGYEDVYKLNNYFINYSLDKCFTSNLIWINNVNNSTLKNEYDNAKFSVDILTNNALYVRDEFKDNSSYYYNTNYFNQTIRNNLDSSYQLILRNYRDFSKIILELSNYLVRGE